MKIIKVKNCDECPRTIVGYCTMVSVEDDMYKHVKDEEWYSIPSWCPLEDYKEADHETPA